MANPQIQEEKPISLAEVKHILEQLEKRDTTLNHLSLKTKEYLENFVPVSLKKKEELSQKLLGLNLTRLKDEQISKIIDFLPKTADELKVVLQAYPLSMPKKDQEAIVAVITETST